MSTKDPKEKPGEDPQGIPMMPNLSPSQKEDSITCWYPTFYRFILAKRKPGIPEINCLLAQTSYHDKVVHFVRVPSHTSGYYK